MPGDGSFVGKLLINIQRLLWKTVLSLLLYKRNFSIFFIVLLTPYAGVLTLNRRTNCTIIDT